MARSLAHLLQVLGKYRGLWRWSPLVALAIGHWAEDPDSGGAVTVAVVAGLITTLELRDRSAARKGKLRMVPQCDHHERNLANEQAIADLQRTVSAGMAVVADWDAIFRAAIGEPPGKLAAVTPIRSGDQRYHAGSRTTR